MRTELHFNIKARKAIAASILTVSVLLTMFAPPPVQAEPVAGKNYRIGARITSFVGTSPRDAEIAMKLIIEELLDDPVAEGLWDTTGLHFDFFRTREEFQEAQKSGKYGLLIGSTIDLIDTIDSLDHDSFYTFDIGGQTKSRYVLITSKTSGFDSLESLTNARIVAPKGGEIGLMWMNSMLRSAGVEPPQEEARTLTPTEDYVDGINKIYFEQGDVALATREALSVAAELNPEIMESLKILGESEPLLTTIAVPTVLPPEAMQFDHLIRNVHLRKAGQSILRLFRCQQIKRGNPSELDSIRRLTDAIGAAT